MVQLTYKDTTYNMEPIEDYKRLDVTLLNIFTSDIDTRLRDVTNLVSLQESELALMWLTIIGLTTYIMIKEHHGR